MVWNVLILSVSFCAWAAIHSLLAAGRVKDAVRSRVGPGVDRWYRFAYVAFASVTLVPILLLAGLLPDRVLYVAPPPWRWLMVLGEVGAVIGMAVAVLEAGPAYFLGLSQLVAGIKGQEDELQVRGLYRYVRHPMYLFSILLLVLMPAMTVNLLTLSLLAILYMVIGSYHEESRLLVEFGEDYREYRRCVPRLLPWRGRCYPRREA